ncbi:hypothetical protein Q9233_002539 [Columba guinea]|nr:hypothetical protein Q9233_002539 [Columba guinea]
MYLAAFKGIVFDCCEVPSIDFGRHWLVEEDPYEVSRRKTRTAPKSSDPTYNEIVVYDNVTELKGHVLKLIVKSKGMFVGAVNIQLSSVQLNEEKWYPLGNSVI